MTGTLTEPQPAATAIAVPMAEPMSESVRLNALEDMHLVLLNPGHDHLITAHLARVHATGRRSKVLDVGIGAGTWTILLARHHPFADVVGIDISWAEFQPPVKLPHGNVDFYTVDVTQPLPWPDNTFDLIHVKSMVMDIPHYPQLVQRLSGVLRPAGLLILVESELSYVSALGPPSDSVVVWSEALRRALAAKNTDADIPRHLDSAIADTGMFWPQFYFQEIGCPVGAYMTGSKALQKAGAIQATVIRASLWRIVSSRLDDGPERQKLEATLDACANELCSPTSRYLQRLFAVYAYKRSSWSDHLLQ
ncbi:hypothetical protein CspeluHIS016_0500440 [Cutaneotrichosporon spelunceum]|uniref:Methyltransferase domain-containing protein n=1 Tax=Cutaneotrichosporon spelunceum TaxID=1672016 RepID=A0AAD3YDJ3_9TREE|nr:hypothetical protein CspeluHIS016_0500440 [Cutaneotrichosporon spelunceum]